MQFVASGILIATIIAVLVSFGFQLLKEGVRDWLKFVAWLCIFLGVVRGLMVFAGG